MATRDPQPHTTKFKLRHTFCLALFVLFLMQSGYFPILYDSHGPVQQSITTLQSLALGMYQQRTDQSNSKSLLVDSALTLIDLAGDDKPVPRPHSSVSTVSPSLSSLLIYTQTTSSHL